MTMGKRLRDMGVLLAGTMMATAAVAATQDAPCDKIAPAIWAGGCQATSQGIVLASTPSRAATLARFAEEGEVRFQTHFDRAAPRYAVVEPADSDTPVTAAHDHLDRQGFGFRLPWMSPTAAATQMTDSIRRGVAASLKDRKLPDTEIEAQVAAAVERAKGRMEPAAAERRERGVVPHELGHGWFIRSYWPTPIPVPQNGRYGSPAPDWMDEVAAVLMEDDALTEQRRQGFRERFLGDADARANVCDLTRYLTIEHPALKSAQQFAPGSATGTPVPPGAKPQFRTVLISGPEAQAIASQGLTFYLQSRLFADYLIDRAGPSRPFVSAAQAFSRGLTTEQWLAAAADDLNIPGTIEALEADWQQWLEKQFPRDLPPA